MKKVSTTSRKQSINFSQQKLTIGLDLGDRSSCYCVLDETGRIVMEQKVSTTAKALQAAFGVMPRSRIALETGMHSPWISRLLSALGHEVIVAHARNMNPEKAEGLSPELQAALAPLLVALESLSEQIGEYNERIETLAQENYPQVALLKQIKGVGTLIALTFLLTLEDPHRFRKSR